MYDRNNIFNSIFEFITAEMYRSFLKNILLSGFLLIIVSENNLCAQEYFAPSENYNQKRLLGTVITESVISTSVMIGLNYLWYKKFKRSKFHFFNDNAEWMLMDKAGHSFSAFTISCIQSDIMQWCGVKSKNAAIIGSATALGYMSMIETFDGYSDKWGFSTGDMAANLAGIALFEGQQLGWKEQRVSIKFSYHFTLFAQYYPQALGSNDQERIIKDYNGQTYWLSANVASFLPARDDFPNWLNVSFGYGAEGMVGARDNPKEINGKTVPDFKRYRQFYLSLDTDLFRINDLSASTEAGYKLNRILKMPAPTLEFNTEGKFKFYPLYY